MTEGILGDKMSKSKMHLILGLLIEFLELYWFCMSNNMQYESQPVLIRSSPGCFGLFQLFDFWVLVHLQHNNKYHSDS